MTSFESGYNREELHIPGERPIDTLDGEIKRKKAQLAASSPEELAQKIILEDRRLESTSQIMSQGIEPIHRKFASIALEYEQHGQRAETLPYDPTSLRKYFLYYDVRRPWSRPFLRGKNLTSQNIQLRSIEIGLVPNAKPEIPGHASSSYGAVITSSNPLFPVPDLSSSYKDNYPFVSITIFHLAEAKKQLEQIGETVPPMLAALLDSLADKQPPASFRGNEDACTEMDFYLDPLPRFRISQRAIGKSDPPRSWDRVFYNTLSSYGYNPSTDKFECRGQTVDDHLKYTEHGKATLIVPGTKLPQKEYPAGEALAVYKEIIEMIAPARTKE